MAELHWFPVFVADWLTSDEITLMLPEQEGAFFRLLLRAWGKGVAEPSIPSDDASLATLSRLGKRWGKLGPLIRAQFEERDGRLYNAKLSEVWNEQQTKHGQAVVRGQNSAKARADKRQTVSRQSPDSGQQLERELEREEARAKESVATAPAIVKVPKPKRLPAPWMGKLNATWKRHMGGDLPSGSATQLSPVVADVGEVEADSRLDAYLDRTDPEFVSLRSFCAKHGTYGDTLAVDPATGTLNGAGMKALGIGR